MVVIVILSGPAVFDNVNEHFKVLLLRGRFMDQVQDESCIQCDFRTLPKRIVLLCALWCSILDKVIHQLHHILIILDVGKGIEAVRAGWLDQVKHLDNIAPFEQQRRYGPERFLR